MQYILQILQGVRNATSKEGARERVPLSCRLIERSWGMLRFRQRVPSHLFEWVARREMSGISAASLRRGKSSCC
jgi:hypothetical protein